MTARTFSAAVMALAVLTGCGARAPAGTGHVDGSAPHWSYAGADGPAAWSSLTPEFAACGAGQRQSPVDLEAARRDTALPPIHTTYSSSRADVANNGHTIQASFHDAGVLNWGGREYALLQLHHHLPGEHTVSGRTADVEVHLVHRAANGDLAVIAVMLEEGDVPSDLVDALIQGGAGSHAVPLTIDPSALLPQNLSYTTYEGSLTTPPCTEGVRWIVLRERGSVSADQLARLDALLPPNARPVPPASRVEVLRSFESY